MVQGSLGTETIHSIWLLGQNTATAPSVYTSGHNLLFLTWGATCKHLYRSGGAMQCVHSWCNHPNTMVSPSACWCASPECRRVPELPLVLNGAPTALSLPSHLRWGKQSKWRSSRAWIHGSETVCSRKNFKFSEIQKKQSSSQFS